MSSNNLFKDKVTNKLLTYKSNKHTYISKQKTLELIEPTLKIVAMFWNAIFLIFYYTW